MKVGYKNEVLNMSSIGVIPLENLIDTFNKVFDINIELPKNNESSKLNDLFETNKPNLGFSKKDKLNDLFEINTYLNRIEELLPKIFKPLSAEESEKIYSELRDMDDKVNELCKRWQA